MELKARGDAPIKILSPSRLLVKLKFSTNGVDRCMRSFELVAEGKLTPQARALDQSARKCVEADIGAAFARRSVGVRLQVEHNHPEYVDRPWLIAPLAFV